MFWLTFTHPFITAHLFWLNLSWEFKNYIHPVHENGRISEALTCFRLIHCNFKELEQMNYFPSRRGMSESVHQILLGTLEILSLKTYMETLNQHRLPKSPETDPEKARFSGVSTQLVFQCWCLHPDEHTAHGNKTPGAATTKGLQRSPPVPLQQRQHSSCAALAMWWGKISPQSPLTCCSHPSPRCLPQEKRAALSHLEAAEQNEEDTADWKKTLRT